MARPLRLEFEGAYYHVMNRALERRRIFETDRDHEYFQSLLLDIADRWKVKIFAYCLMGDHYHLFTQMRFSAQSSHPFRRHGSHPFRNMVATHFGRKVATF